MDISWPSLVHQERSAVSPQHLLARPAFNSYYVIPMPRATLYVLGVHGTIDTNVPEMPAGMFTAAVSRNQQVLSLATSLMPNLQCLVLRADQGA
eukprot:981031-Pelagomonas_calceolata.AAC.2